MIIRSDQLHTLSQNQGEAYILRVTRFLQEHFPDAAEEPLPTLSGEVARQIDRGRLYGFRTEREIVIYVITAWVLGPDFDVNFPAAAEVLTTEIPPAAKACFLEEWTNEMLGSLVAYERFGHGLGR